MKACRAPRTCHKATTEEDLSRIDTLAWTYPKVGNMVMLLISSDNYCKLSKMACWLGGHDDDGPAYVWSPL